MLKLSATSRLGDWTEPAVIAREIPKQHDVLVHAIAFTELVSFRANFWLGEIKELPNATTNISQSQNLFLWLITGLCTKAVQVDTLHLRNRARNLFSIDLFVLLQGCVEVIKSGIRKHLLIVGISGILIAIIKVCSLTRFESEKSYINHNILWLFFPNAVQIRELFIQFFMNSCKPLSSHTEYEKSQKLASEAGWPRIYGRVTVEGKPTIFPSPIRFSFGQHQEHWLWSSPAETGADQNMSGSRKQQCRLQDNSPISIF